MLSVKADRIHPPSLRIRPSDVEHPLSRLLTLLELLQAHRHLSGTELAHRLEVTPRTVRRYVTTLQELGIPVRAEIGRHGGYRLRPGYRLPPLVLNGEEALAVVLSLLAAGRLGLTTGTQAVEGALAKLHRVLPDPLRRQVEATREVVGWGSAPRHPDAARDPIHAGILLALGVAAHDGRQVLITHRSGGGETATERALDPYGIVFQGGRWYVAGLDHLRSEVRTFRVDRVLTVLETGLPATRPAGFDAVAHVQRSIASVPYTWSVEALLALPPADARSLIPPTLGSLAERADGMLLRFGTDDLAWAARYLVGLGCRFCVFQPDELVDAVRRLAQDLLAMTRAR
jgi:predicted DNA-binding transcriptional regulator YafY